MKLRAAERLALAPYRRALPAHEADALETWLGTFWPFQRPWILETNDTAISCKARQIGISHTTAAVGVLWGAFHGELTTIISVGELESAEVLEKARRHARLLSRFGSRQARLTVDNTTELGFASGGRVLALPSSGGRSFTGNVFLDEFAYQQHARKVWDAAAAVTMLGGRLRVASTPNGIGNEFHRLWSDPEAHAGWSRHEIPLSAAIADGYPADLAKCRKLAKGDPRIFAQLFECTFLDNELQYLPTELIDAARVDDLYTADGDYFAGLDIGRSVDLTALVVLRRTDDGGLSVAYVETCKRTDSDALKAMVARAFALFDLKALAVDATGGGAWPCDDMQKRHGRHRVEPFVFSLESKEHLATGLYSALSERRLRLPRTDAALPEFRDAHTNTAVTTAPGNAELLRNALCSIRRIVTAAGNVRYDAPHTDQGHADHAWGLALAVHAASGPSRRRYVIGDDGQAAA